MRFLCLSLLLCGGVSAQTQLQQNYDSRNYNFVRTVGQGTSGSLSTSGAGKILTLRPCPWGLSTSYAVRIVDGSASELATPTAVSCPGGASSGTITISTVNSYSGSWSIRSATAGIQEAITTGGGNSMAVTVPAGSVNTYSSVVVTGNEVTIAGTGKGSRIAPQFTTGSAFYFNGLGLGNATGYRNTIRDLGIGFPTVGTAVMGVRINGQVQFLAKSVRINNVNRGFSVEGQATTSIVRIIECEIEGLTPVTGIGIHQLGGADVYINHNVILGFYADQPHSGIRLDYSTGSKILENEVFATGFGLYIGPGDGELVLGLESISNWYDSGSEDGIAIVPTGTGEARLIRSVADWCSVFTRNGIEIGSSGVVNGVTFINPLSRDNTESGVLHNGGTNIEFIGAVVTGNSNTSAGTYHGITVASGIGRFKILGGVFGQTAGSPNTQGYGILVNGGASDNYSIQGVTVTPNVTGGIADGGTGLNRVVKDNIGSTNVMADLVAAGSLDIGTTAQEVFRISGTTQVTTISRGWNGRTIILIFTDASPGGVGTGGNIGRVQTAAQNQSIRLTFDGTAWY